MGEAASTAPVARRHLLGIEEMSRTEIVHLIDRADLIADCLARDNRPPDPLPGHLLISLFFENSTRTRASFQIAGQHLGFSVVDMSLATSSTGKGETLLDTAMTLNAMRPDVLVVRHAMSGVPHLLSHKVNCAVINAGDGNHEHPTQALTDALTIRRRKGTLEGLTVAICGDIMHSRVARSNMRLLTIMGSTVRVVAPATLMPAGIEAFGAQPFESMAEGLDEADVVMMLRLQLERMHGSLVPSTREYFRFFGLDSDKLRAAKDDAVIMHPGPINRGTELDSVLADDIGRSLILEQVAHGVAVRIAVLEALVQDAEEGVPG
ncbi:MAG: aspartate carbamoyltransferase catalytic subunit [Rhodospirillales bacterium]|nr:aspartate carbamoyltransferase catalytic subunit [Rhodospirillales bacterium]